MSAGLRYGSCSLGHGGDFLGLANPSGMCNVCEKHGVKLLTYGATCLLVCGIAQPRQAHCVAASWRTSGSARQSRTSTPWASRRRCASIGALLSSISIRLTSESALLDRVDLGLRIMALVVEAWLLLIEPALGVEQEEEEEEEAAVVVKGSGEGEIGWKFYEAMWCL